ncbi:MAG: PadR family transcriptional regulator [Candidatus Woesearchaeota archaeon]
MIKSNLRFIVLKILDTQEMSGYGLVKEIHTFTKTWKPSYGSIYPLLKDLHAKKLVAVHEQGRKKLYTITAQGHKRVQEFEKNKEEIFDRAMDSIKNMELICDKKEIDFIYKWHQHMRSDPLPFKDISAQVHELAELLMTISANPQLSAQYPKIQGILRQTIQKLRIIEKRKKA